MDRFTQAEDKFRGCLSRSLGICELQQYLSDNNSSVLDTTDILRASVVLSVSAFDFLIHELFRIEVIARYRTGRTINRLVLPFNVTVTENSNIEMLIEAHINHINSYKSFVDPGKYADAIGCFVEAPWEKIAIKTSRDVSEIKTRIRAIYRWRNRIVHEADINPVYSGVGLWAIEKDDVVNAISDIEQIGIASVDILREG